MEIYSKFLPLQPGDVALKGYGTCGCVLPRGCGTKEVWHLSKFVNMHNFVIFYARNLIFCMILTFSLCSLGMSHLDGVAPWGVVPRGCGTKGVCHIIKFKNMHNFVFFYARNLHGNKF